MTTFQRALQWDTARGRALAIFYNHQRDAGLTYWEAQQIAERLHPDAHGLGSCWWKRCGELHTEYDDPLIVPARTIAGAIVKRPGPYGDSVGAWKITDAGIYAYWQMRSGQS